MSGMPGSMHRAALTAILIVTAACGSKTEQASAPPATSDAAAATVPAPAAPAVTQASWAPDALEELVAPIALYPDALLGQILGASVNVQEVLDAGNWLLENESLKGDALDAAAQKAGFGPATRALVQFPTVVDMMCQQIDWTRQLSSAFTSDQKGVLDAVQRLRTQAAQVGNLKSTPEQTVETKQESGKVVVEVKPADPKVVYVPQYDPQQVYTTPPPTQQSSQTSAASSSSTSSSSSSGTVSTGAAVAGGLLAFGVGIALGHALDDHDDYCYPHWGTSVVFVGPRPFYPPAYVYRPAYGPAFHPAYRYAPPPGYRHSYNNVNVNVNRNVVVNNNNYFNRFNNNQNVRVGNVQSPLGGTRQTAATQSWRGQSTYAGTRNAATSDRAAVAQSARSEATRTTAQARSSEANRADRVQPDRAQHVDRGYGESTRVPNRDGGASNRVAQAPTGEAREPARSAPREQAFSGAAREGDGSFERAASARGRASAGTHSAHVGHAARRG